MSFLKLAETSDTFVVLNLLEDLFNSSIYSTISKFDSFTVLERLTNVIEGNRDEGCVLLLKKEDKTVGVLIISFFVPLFNKDEKVGVELAFYIEPEYRTKGNIKKLMSAYRFWAKRIGCKAILVGKIKNKNEVESTTIRRIV